MWESLHGDAFLAVKPRQQEKPLSSASSKKARRKLRGPSWSRGFRPQYTKTSTGEILEIVVPKMDQRAENNIEELYFWQGFNNERNDLM
jgi:hypothetical protein